jgi:hypothetical protein
MRIIEIFRPGKFRAMNGKEIEFSAAMLDDIAKSYNPSAYKAPLVIGHPKVEDPAYGWVRGLNFANGKLQAEPESVVEEFAGIVSAGMYKNVSASFFTPDHPANPQPGKYYLKHVGFLGAVPPAVTGLKPVSFASDDSNELCFEFAANDAPPALPIEVDSKIKSTIDFAAMERALEEREQRLKQKVKELEKAEFAAFIGDLKKNGQILPSAESGLVEFMSTLSSGETLEFAGAKQTPLDFFKSFLKKQPKVVSFAEFAPESDATKAEITPRQLAERAEKLKTRLEHEGMVISYADAVTRASEGEE